MKKMYLNLILIFLISVSCATTKNKSAFTKMDRKAELYYDYGTQYLVEKDYTKALKSLKSAYAIEPKNTFINNNLGMSYFFKKNIQKSLFHVKKAIEIDPNNSDARNNLASLYFYQKKYKQAYMQYEKILEDLEYSQQYRTYYNLALIDLKFGRNKIANERLKKSIQDNNNYCPAHFQLGTFAKKVNQYNKALKHFSDAIKGECVNTPVSHFEKAKMHILLGQDERALFSLQEIINRFPESKFSILAKRKLQKVNIGKINANKKVKEPSRL